MGKKEIERTLLKSMTVKNFRNMQDISFEFGERLTVISGKNGTAKSTILGLVAQIFSFEKDVIKNETISHFKTLNDRPFKSQFNEHFRLSEEFDRPGEMDVRYNVYDAYFKEEIKDLKLTMTATDGRKHRTVVRNNLPTQYSENTSRNVTHPVVYLSLKRLLPIPERDNNKVSDIDYIQKNMEEFIEFSNEIIGKTDTTNITSTKGIIDSSVVHGDNYDHQSVSTGEDNVGQIVQALFSFKKLKDDYPDYHGGLLIIDEIDAGLFPYAQNRIIDVLIHFSRLYQIQIILSTHSPIIIEKIYDKSLIDSRYFKNIFLTAVFGKLEVKNDFNWRSIYNDLMIKTDDVSEGLKLPTVNIYFEDAEARDFFKRLIINKKINKLINRLDNVSLGCQNYISLINKGVPEFSRNSLIVLDADVNIDKSLHSNIILLPSSQPPDRLLFRFLLLLAPSDSYWKNEKGFTKEVFNTCANVQKIKRTLQINENTTLEEFDVKVKENIESNDKKELRKLFKGFYQDANIQKVIKTVRTNPFEYYLKANPEEKHAFQEEFVGKLALVLTEGMGAPKAEVYTYLNI